MKASELMIGNWIIEYGIDYAGENKYVDKADISYVQIDAGILSVIINEETEACLYDVIVLTEKIFNNLPLYTVGELSGKGMDYCSFTFMDGVCALQFEGCRSSKVIKYVHELQNAYNSLSEDELIVKL